MSQGMENTIEWQTDGKGAVLARIDRNAISHTDRLVVYSGGNEHEGGTFPVTGDSDSGIVGVSEDGKAVMRLGRAAGGVRTLVRRDLASGAQSDVFAPQGYDVGGPIKDEWTGRVAGVTYVDDKREYRFLDPKREALQRGVEQAFPGKSAGIVSSDMAADKLVVATDGPAEPPIYYLLDRATHNMRPVAVPYPDLMGVPLGEMKSHDYVARDGLAIHAYLTLPPGKPATNLPLVVMPHGGPDARDHLGFDWWAQFLANRGYAVLQPNYRGSAGYGEAFTQAGLRQWGLKMQDDISDGVKQVIAEGIADPKRVCIVGASYGGYAALAGAALSPDLYACAVAVAGVSDLPLMLRTEHRMTGENSQASHFWATRIGSSDENWDQLVATSPARHAASIRAPVLLIHGEGDTTVRIDQSEAMADALKAAGKSVTFIRIPGEDHYLNQTSTRVRVLSETEKFLEKYIGK
jgi:dipeptidyl aminopeptidase/acylaminoacyl peptidase